MCKRELAFLFFFFFFQHTSPFFPRPLRSHTHSHGEIPDSWPTCLGSLMLSSVVADTSTPSSFIIRRLCTNTIPLLPFLVPSPWRKPTLTFLFLSLFLPGASGQRVKVEPEVLSYPGQTVNLRCAFTDAAGIQLTMVRYTLSWHNSFLFFHLGFDYFFLPPHSSSLNWVCGMKF